MKNKRILVIPPIVLYIIWLILIPILFKGQHWGFSDESTVAWLYFFSTVGLAGAVGTITVVGYCILSGFLNLACWIMDGAPQKLLDPILKEAEKEVEEFLKED